MGVLRLRCARARRRHVCRNVLRLRPTAAQRPEGVRSNAVREHLPVAVRGTAIRRLRLVYTDVNLLTHPLDVSFRIHKLNPLECDYGMGATDYYLSRLDKDWKTSPRRREYVDLFLATTIAYGNMGWLVDDWGLDDPFGVEVIARSYYMLQQIQQQYAFQRPARIEYADRAGRWETPSQAHASGAKIG